LKSSQAFETRCGELEKVDANASRVEEPSSVSITELFGEKATLQAELRHLQFHDASHRVNRAE
jgi:hypothetical protein